MFTKVQKVAPVMCLLDVFGVVWVHMVSGSVDHSWRLTDSQVKRGIDEECRAEER